MYQGRLTACLLGVATAGMLLCLPGPAPRTAAQQPITPIKGGVKPAQKGVYEVIQEFPSGGPMQTAWKVRYVATNPGPGLAIAGAWFKTGPRADWLKVIENIRLSEIFVPYNDGTLRLHDIGAQGECKLLRHTRADAGANGKLLHDGLVVRELRDGGILWKFYEQVRRAEDLVLWSTMEATNYNYIMEYAFRGDGSITCRLGSTGKNLEKHETMGHMHNGCWRIDVDLDDPARNSVFLVKHSEPRGTVKPTDVATPFNNGVEGAAAWNSLEFTRLRVQSTRKNGQGKYTSYELVPLRWGTQRHWGRGEEFTHYDFWVTPYRWNEQYYVNLPRMVTQRRKITNTNVVLWHMSPAYHLPRDEDGIFIGPNGVAQVRGVYPRDWAGGDALELSTGERGD
ncbi:MAG: hypothetical protein L0Z62_00780 [Gemmataceae bacterium]|nr:hypothetical protein [Gemmataceae bacterium]